MGFVYKETQEVESTPSLRQPEHPPTSAVDVVENEEDRFIVPKGLAVPGHIRMVSPSHVQSPRLYSASMLIGGTGLNASIHPMNGSRRAY